jgi:polyisoprenyl-phosphate glycosyltransferase
LRSVSKWSLKNHAEEKIVVIVPCYNEEESIVAMVAALNNARTAIKDKFTVDILLINDGSSDDTQSIIMGLVSKNSSIYYREFTYNAGHQSAIRAGLDVAADYDAAIMMDADLQHPPECIAEMLHIWQTQKVSIVQMIRNDSQNEVGIIKYWTSKGYYKLINFMSGLDLVYGSSDFRLIDNSVIKTVANSPERDLFLRGYFSWLKVSRYNLGYRPSKRYAGQSKYTFKKMFALGRKGVLQFSEKPLRLATNLGLFMAVASFLYGIYIIGSYLMGDKVVSGWTSLMVVMLFCFGVNFILLGFIGRYLAHSIYLQKRRPDYIVLKEKLSVIK